MVGQSEMSDPILTRMVAEDKTPWYKKRHLRLMYVYLFLCCMGVEITSGFDSTLIGTLQFSPPWNKYFSDGAKDKKGEPTLSPSILGFVSSCYQLGSIIGVPVAPWFNQKFGRRWAVMAGSLIMVVGAMIQGFAQNLGMYIFARMLLGFGIVFCIIAGSALIGELAHPKERSTLTSLFNASYFIGQITASAISLATTEIKNDWSWRIPSLLQAAPSFLQIGFIFMLPESPRFLVSKDRDDEAYEILIKYHAEGDADSVLAKAEMAQIKSTIMIELENSKSSWMDMVRTSGMRRRVLISAFLGLFTQMSGNTLLSYYQNLLYEMMGYTSTFAKTRINLANACWSLLTGVTAALIVARFRRRSMFMLSSGSMLAVFTAMTVAFQQLRKAKDQGRRNKAAGIAALFFYFSYGPCYNIGNNALTYTFLVELFPYAQRTRGIGIEQVFGKIGGFFSQNVNPIALDAIDWKFLAIYCGWISFEFLFIYFFYPETSGRTLEELAFLFEDKEFADKAVVAVEKQIHHEDMDVDEEKRAAIVHEEGASSKV
ncbi:hexose transporter-like protein [Amylocarpus encephaloides]|uniref:Hexose transporter-like protein n=1 Tax=Amylocarpus encephaloides TaxID=45428 RepID=A0A9P7YSL6_9HELO|nr:hexose transporter-like protein [Amylocarpus encephaloides]